MMFVYVVREQTEEIAIRLGGKALEELVAFFNENPQGCKETVLSYLREKGRLRLLEAGVNRRIYWLITFTGEKKKIELRYDQSRCYVKILS